MLTSYTLMAKKVAYGFCLICVSIGTPVANAWGPLGHQVVCDLAWRESPAAIQQYLAQAAKRVGYNTFAESCVWADHIKSRRVYDYLKPMHYVNGTRGVAEFRAASCKTGRKQSPTCVITAIEHFSKRINNTALTQRQRDQALLLVGHFIADIHQPLHVSYKDDRGGTRLYVTFYGKRMSLHQLWDSQLLTCNQGSNKKRNWRKLGQSLYRTMPKAGTMQVKQWARESFAITQTIYNELNRLDKPVLSQSYCQRHQPELYKRLQLAGVRLAKQLAEHLPRTL